MKQKKQVWDVIRIRYNWALSNLPAVVDMDHIKYCL